MLALAAGRARFARCVSNAGGKPEPWTERPADAGNAQILHFNEKKIFRDIIYLCLMQDISVKKFIKLFISLD